MNAEVPQYNVENRPIFTTATWKIPRSSRMGHTLKGKSPFNKKTLQSQKRKKNNCYLENPEKENSPNHVKHGGSTQSKMIRKQGESTFSNTRVLAPIKLNSGTQQKTSKNEICRIEKKALRRETDITISKYQQKLINIDKNEEPNKREDFVSPPTTPVFSHKIFKEEVVHQVSSTWSKSKKSSTFKVSTPLVSAAQHTINFASSSFLNCPELKTSKTSKILGITPYRDLDPSTVKEVLEADMCVKSQNTFSEMDTITEKVREVEQGNEKLFNRGKTFIIDKSKVLILESSSPKDAKETNGLFNRGKTFVIEDSRDLEISSLKHCKTQRASPFKHHRPTVKIADKIVKSVKKKSIRNNPLVGTSKNKENQSFKNRKENSLNFNDSNDVEIKFGNTDPFFATAAKDPFFSNTVYFDKKQFLLQELKFKKWLNAVLTAPKYWCSNADSSCVDILKIWKSYQMKREMLAESKDSFAARYHTDMRLNILRSTAWEMFTNKEVDDVFSGITHLVENEKLVFRSDKNLHLNVGLQKKILELFHNYNPLWLRIGLETIYEEMIPLQSNNDSIGLTNFLLARFFSDPCIIKKHSHPTIAGMKFPTFRLHMEKFMLKIFLQVVYFLDYAKLNKLIDYNPCLFRKKAMHKESLAILLSFSSEVLSGIGDFAKLLKSSGYVVKYKQTYLEEFDYAVNDMSSDLRDGVRLCRLVELITGKRNLTSLCTVPAIDRLQKIRNVNCALTTLMNSGYLFSENINAKSITDGHREKTLSLLWQIIQKYQTLKREKAARCLQRAWKCYSAKKKLNQLRADHEKNLELRKKSALIIEEWWILQTEGIKERIKYLETKLAALKIQRWWRRNRDTKPFVEELRKKHKAVVLIQRIWRAKKLMEKEPIPKEREEFIEKKRAAVIIQRFWKRYRATKTEVTNFQVYRRSCVKIQSWWRSVLVRRKYQIQRRSCVKIQKWWRFLQETKACQARFSEMENAPLVVQENSTMMEAKGYLIKLVILIIKFWFEKILISQSSEFSRQKDSVTKIENWWLNLKIARHEREKYLNLKAKVQDIQRIWRGKKVREEFVEYRRVVVMVQSKWRMKMEVKKYQRLKEAATKIQNWWRLILIRRKCRNDDLQLKETVNELQRRQRAKEIKKKYHDRQVTLLRMYSCYRTLLARKQLKELFMRHKKSLDVIENFWKEMSRTRQIQEERVKELRKVEAAVKIQAAWRGYKVRKTESAKIAILKEKIKKAAVRAIPSKTLNSRLKNSINVLFVSNDVGRLSMCLSSLEIMTNLSPTCCMTVCKVGLVDKIFMTLVRANRSLPWMEASMRATRILITLAKYPPTKQYVLKTEYIETLARFLKITVEKEVQLFLHLATLMWVLLEDSDYAGAVLKDSRSIWLLKSLCDTITRKKQKMPHARSKVKEEVLPNPKPDWGLKQKQPPVFCQVHHAATCVLTRLGINSDGLNRSYKK